MSERIFRKICGIDVSVDPDDPNIDVEEAFRFAETAVEEYMKCCVVVIRGIKHPNAYVTGYRESEYLKNSGRMDYKEVSLKNGKTIRVYPSEKQGLTVNDITDLQLTQAKRLMEDSLSVERDDPSEEYYLMD